MSFTKVPNKLFELNLTIIEFGIMVYLLKHDLDKFTPSQRLIAEQMNIHRDTVRIAINSLKAKGLITVTTKKPVNGTFINQYKINTL
jgi:DNA-binding MarR family transcriptional regulator